MKLMRPLVDWDRNKVGFYIIQIHVCSFFVRIRLVWDHGHILIVNFIYLTHFYRGCFCKFVHHSEKIEALQNLVFNMCSPTIKTGFYTRTKYANVKIQNLYNKFQMVSDLYIPET